MASHSRKRGRPAPAPAAAPAPADADGSGEPDPMRKGYARGRARDEAIREGLQPLAPGERPRVVTFAAIIAFALAVANAAAALSGNDIASTTGDPSTTTVVVTALLLVMGIGMLRRNYLAVLAFQMVIGIQIVFFSLYLIGVQKWWQALVQVVAIVLLGWLFWKLVRPMARLQMTARQPGQPGR